MNTLLPIIITTLGSTVSVDLPVPPDGGDRFVEADGCKIVIQNDQVSGPVDCRILVAMVDAQGNVTRKTVVLVPPASTVAAPLIEQTSEDQPEVEEDKPEARPDPKPAPPRQDKARQSSRGQAVDRTSKRTEQPPTRSEQTNPAKNQDFSFGPSFMVQRDWGDFGFSTYGVALEASFFDTYTVNVRWDGGSGRTTTSVVDVVEAVEQSLDVLTLGARYLVSMNARAHVYAGGRLGLARIETDALTAERQQLTASTQSVFVLGPSVGLGYTVGAALLRMGYGMLWATGDWYPANEYGSGEGDGPPKHSGAFTHNLEVGIGFRL
ncbi:MAG: hypothetical protein VX589_13990 [Myxococcota bacterium]|nr:hypothetical protein [Myxococcota bacterium]